MVGETIFLYLSYTCIREHLIATLTYSFEKQSNCLSNTVIIKRDIYPLSIFSFSILAMWLNEIMLYDIG
jgi:hypothetical protein